jgi:type II secretory pathway pseudopilin PulG
VTVRPGTVSSPASSRAARGRQGFSSTQLLAALGVILVTALVLPALGATLVNRARVARAQERAGKIADAVRAARRDMGTVPARRRWLPAAHAAETGSLDLLTGAGQEPRTFRDVRWGTGATDTLLSQLVDNGPGYPGPATGSALGWSGPYLPVERLLPDPWGNRFLVNIGAGAEAGTPPGAVWVLSAGPNGIVETPFLQPAAHARLGGDDVGVRVW